MYTSRQNTDLPTLMFTLTGFWIYSSYKNEINTMKGYEYVYKKHRNVSLKISQTRINDTKA